jgi:hypothetical protein
MENEVWKDVIGYEGLYQVSNLGNVETLPRKWIGANGAKRSHNGFILSKRKDPKGYLTVDLCKDSIKKIKRIHVLVAESFLGHKPCGMNLIIDHINNDKKDNRLENLQIVTNRFNVSKSRKEGTSKFTGVSLRKRKYKDKIYFFWVAQIHINGINNYLGVFKTEIEACNAYKNALKNI